MTVDWKGLERATHADPAGRNLATLAVGGRYWDAGHLEAAAQDLANRARRVIIVTGFCRWSSVGMTAETDGPPGALLLARACWRWESMCCWSLIGTELHYWTPAATTWAWVARSRTKCRSNSTMPTTLCRRAITGAKLFSPDRRRGRPIWWRSNGPVPVTRLPRSPGNGGPVRRRPGDRAGGAQR